MTPRAESYQKKKRAASPRTLDRPEQKVTPLPQAYPPPSRSPLVHFLPPHLAHTSTRVEAQAQLAPRQAPPMPPPPHSYGACGKGPIPRLGSAGQNPHRQRRRRAGRARKTTCQTPGLPSPPPPRSHCIGRRRQVAAALGGLVKLAGVAQVGRHGYPPGCRWQASRRICFRLRPSPKPPPPPPRHRKAPAHQWTM